MATFHLKIDGDDKLLIDNAGHYLIIGMRVAGAVTQRDDLEGPSQESVQLVGPSSEEISLEGPSQQELVLVGPSLEEFAVEGPSEESPGLGGP